MLISSTMIVTGAEPDKVLALMDLIQLQEAGEIGSKKLHWISYFSHRCDKAPNKSSLREEKGLELTVMAGNTKWSSWQQPYVVETS